MVDIDRNTWSLIQSHNDTERQVNDSRGDERRERQWKDVLGGCCGSLGPLLIGLTLGVLVGGVVLATFVALYLVKPATRISTVTVIITAPAPFAMTNASITTTTTTSTTTTSSSTYTSSVAIFNVNLVNNGDAETGNCDRNGTVTSPIGWMVSGPISQVAYASGSFFVDQNYGTPGPSNRGACYFMGHISAYTSMSQTIMLTNQVDAALIDNLTVKFNFSAWIGGLTNQDDSATISLSFLNQANQTISNSLILGPVSSIDRRNQSSLIFQQFTGYVPVGARVATLLVAITRATGSHNNGDVDNIAFYLFQ